MSTKPRLDDQTQAALSAIEEALKGTAAKPEPRLPEATSVSLAALLLGRLTSPTRAASCRRGCLAAALGQGVNSH